MKIVFVQNFLNFYLGIMSMSSVLKKNGHSVDVFVEGLHKDIIKDICDAKPDIIGFTCITGEHRWVEKRAAQIKKHLNVPIIVGGPHPTYFPEMVEMENIDIVCRGEGEGTILELIDKMQNRQEINNILGLWVKQDNKIYKNNVAPLVEDLDSLPLADRGIYDKYEFFRKEKELPIAFSRGCPYSCSFCYNAAKRKLYAGQKVVRIRSVDNVISEIKLLLQEHPHFKSILFYDDNIGLLPKWFDEFCEKYAKVNGPSFVVSVRADFMNEDRAKKLKKANCFSISMGVESGDHEMREKILNKHIPDEDYIQASRFLRENGIKVRTSNILFLPGETIDQAFKTLLLNKKMKVDFAWVYTLQPYPGTEIYHYAVENGFLDKNFSFDQIDPLGVLESPVITNPKDRNKIKVLQKLFYYGVKIPGFDHLMKLLVYIPDNFVFDLFHRFSILINYIAFHQFKVFRFLKMALDTQKATERG